MKSVALSEFLGQVKAALQGSFSKGVWVTAEILSISGGGHRYLELVEYDEARREVAKARGVIWKTSAGMLDTFNKATGIPLQANMKVLVRVSPRFHESFGFSLIIEEIDPAFTLGLMEMRIKAIRTFLKEKGISEANKQLKTPQDFFRLAVISPADAAGLGDFRTEADHIAALGLCTFDYYHASFQGETAGDQIVDAMANVVAAHKIEAYDAAVVIRGGGDKAGLYQLNHKRLCHAVCRFPLPIIIGIGHERDKLLLDELVNLRLATPSLVISHIKQKMIENANAAHGAFESLDRAAQKILSEADEQSNRLLENLLSASERAVENADSSHRILLEQILTKSEQKAIEAQQIAQRSFEKVIDLSDRLNEKAAQSSARLAEHMLSLADRHLDQAESDSKNLMTQIMAANPMAILAQGYGYVRNSSGKYLTRSTQAQAGEKIFVNLQDGAFSAIITTHAE